MPSSVRSGVDKDEPIEAREGTIWMCPHCGRTNKNRYSMSDSSCVTAAVLVLNDSIMRDENGVAIGAAAANDPESEITW